MEKKRGAKLPQYLYHLVDTTNWVSIQQHGLLSTSMLLERVGIEGNEREQLERRYREQELRLSNGIVIRDQRPMPPQLLERCLHKMTPSDWYALLNAQVFFWLDLERLKRMLKANHTRPQIVMTIDAGKLLKKYAEQAEVTPFNTGNARRKAALRGRETFVPYLTWLESQWLSEAEALGIPQRSARQQPVELTIIGAVPDIMDFVVEAKQLSSEESL